MPSDQHYSEPTVGALIFDPAGRLFLMKSHKWGGKYVVPGGHVCPRRLTPLASSTGTRSFPALVSFRFCGGISALPAAAFPARIPDRPPAEIPRKKFRLSDPKVCYAVMGTCEEYRRW